MCPGVPQTNSSSRSLTSCACVMPKCRAASSSPTPWRCSSHGTMASSRDRRSADAAVTTCSPPCSPRGAVGRRRPRQRRAQHPDDALAQVRRLDRDDVRPVSGQLVGQLADVADDDVDGVPAGPPSGWPPARPRPPAAAAAPPGRRAPAPAPPAGRAGSCVGSTSSARLEVRRAPRSRRPGPPAAPRPRSGTAGTSAGRPGRGRWPTTYQCRAAAGEHPRLDPPACRLAVRRPVGEGDRQRGRGWRRRAARTRAPAARTLGSTPTRDSSSVSTPSALSLTSARAAGPARLGLLPDPAGEAQDRQLLAR